MNFSSCYDHIKVNNKRLLYFLPLPSSLSISFLRTSSFKAQHVGSMLQLEDVGLGAPKMNAGFPESISDNFNRLQLEPVAQSVVAIEYTDCSSAEEVRTPLMCVLDMTLNNLMVRFQWCWGFGEYGAPLYCHCSGPAWVAPNRALSMGWIELTAYLC